MRSKGLSFYCFSPPVMLATFAVEVGLLVYVLIRYKMTPVVRVAAAMLFFLAVFQLAEYNVCEGSGLSAHQWSRVGFVAITMLPALGVHLAQLIAKRPNRSLTLAAYATALVAVLAFGTSDWAFAEQVCNGNYVIFRLRPNIALLYSIYYYGWLLAAMWLCAHFAAATKGKARLALEWQVIGYLVFLIPTAVVTMLNTQTTAGIPSIMCGFAVLFAFVLVFVILPHALKKKDYR